MMRVTRQPIWRKAFIKQDDGSALLLMIGATALVITIVFAGVSATSLYLERKRLLTLADGASLAAAEAFDLGSARFTGGHVVVQLTNDRIEQAVQGYLADAGERGVTITEASTRDGRSATVGLTAVWHPPVISLLMPDGLEVSVSSTARSVFGSAQD